MKATYVKTQPKNVITVSRIVTVHYYEFDKSFVFLGESHDFWEMVYIDKGRVGICRDEEELTLSQGEIVFHRPNEFHSIRALDSAPNFFVISFDCRSPLMAYLEKHRTTLDKTMHGFIASIISEAERTYEIPKNDPDLRRLVRRQVAPIGGEQLIKTYLEQFLILLIRNIVRQDEPCLFPSKESMETHLVSRVKALLTERAERPVCIGDLCAELGYSKSYLSRLFRLQTGETMGGFAMRCRIGRAGQLIREGEYNFAEISDLLAFENPQYFSRVFKRIMKMTPTEYRLTVHRSRNQP